MNRYVNVPSQVVFNRLSNDRRVVNLLTPSKAGEKYSSVDIEEGRIEPSKAGSVLVDWSQMGMRSRRKMKGWAKAFRSKINSYVYRKGNGSEPQTWPLIRCVKLQGPWTALSTGAALVDLPGMFHQRNSPVFLSDNQVNVVVAVPINR